MIKLNYHHLNVLTPMVFHSDNFFSTFSLPNLDQNCSTSPLNFYQGHILRIKSLQNDICEFLHNNHMLLPKTQKNTYR